MAREIGQHIEILEFLKTINDVRFTARELDILACLIHGRSAKKVATLLSVAPKTIENHTQNVMNKLQCNSREGILDFIEKSGKIALFRNHYTNLVINDTFEKCLKAISNLQNQRKVKSLIIKGLNEDLKNVLLKSLLFDLKSAGLPLHELKEKKKPEDGIVGFALALKSDPDQPVEEINIGNEGEYYLAFFLIIQELIATDQLKKIIKEFKDTFDTLTKTQEPIKVVISHEAPQITQPFNEASTTLIKLLRKKLAYIILLFLGSAITCYFLFFNPLIIKEYSQSTSIVRSDLRIPKEEILLLRSDMVHQLDKAITKSDGIKTIALIGIGGAGKSTLARLYANQQPANVKWELNSESKTSLKNSFEKLANALSQTKADHETLNEIKEIKNREEKEIKLVQYVKDHLKSCSGWVLIFDNVENFADIQDYFPNDISVWGQGKVLLTTRNINIQNNGYVGASIFINELNDQQKLGLFLKIMGENSSYDLSKENQEHIKRFLERIPPFPLDVSTAAYYLKATNIPLEQYLIYLEENNKDFSSIQETLLKEASGYTQTRYGIISISLQRLLQTNNDFGELLLLMSLIDSQCIPRGLLRAAKSDLIVDNFFVNLKKYSLIANEPSGPNLICSLHRSIQATSLAYLIKAMKLNKEHPDFQSISNVLENYVNQITEHENFNQIELIANHCERLLSHHSLLSDDIKANLNGYLGALYYHLGYYKKAKDILEKAVNATTRPIQKASFRRARALGYLGIVYKNLGNYELAKDKLEESTHIYQENPSQNYYHTAWSLANLGDAYNELGQYEKAKIALNKSLLIYRSHLPDNHLGKARALLYLANVAREQEDLENARNLLDESLAVMYRQEVSKDNPRVARVLVRLGDIYARLGNYEKATTLINQGLLAYKAHFSANHIDVAWTLFKLGDCHRKAGNFKESIKVLEQSLHVYKKHYSENHIRVARLSVCLGKAYRDANEYQKAIELFKKSLVVYEQHYGNEHLETAFLLKYLAQAYLQHHEIDKAEYQLLTAINIVQKNKDPNLYLKHPDMYMIYEDLADLYRLKSMQFKTKEHTQESQELRSKSISYLQQAKDFAQKNIAINSLKIEKLQSKIDNWEKPI